MAKIEPIRVEVDIVVREVVHMCPPAGSGLMPCCGKTPFEVPPWSSRITLNPKLVTCKGSVSEGRDEP